MKLKWITQILIPKFCNKYHENKNKNIELLPMNSKEILW